MSVISTALRNFKEPSKEELTHIFFSIPPVPESVAALQPAEKPSEDDVEKMEINAVLSLGDGEEDSYVRLQRSR